MLQQDLERTIIISEPIDENIAKDVITQIMAINKFDQALEDTMKDYQAEPIELVINSPGGSATDGFAIIGAMEMSTTPIITYGIGMVASMALAIFLAGDIRISGRHTRFMYHSVSYGFGGHITDHEAQLVESNILNQMYDEVILDNTRITKEKQEEVRKLKEDYFLSAIEAKELGLVDAIIQKPEKRLEVDLGEGNEEVEIELEIPSINEVNEVDEKSVTPLTFDELAKVYKELRTNEEDIPTDKLF